MIIVLELLAVCGAIFLVFIVTFFLSEYRNIESIWGEKEKNTQKLLCEHDVCAECKHMIEKGSGQTVVVEDSYYFYSYPTSISKLIYCNLHKKPYDEIYKYKYNSEGKTHYYKKINPLKRVNEDGTDYEAKTTTDSIPA